MLASLCIIRRRCVQVAVQPYLLYSSSSREAPLPAAPGFLWRVGSTVRNAPCAGGVAAIPAVQQAALNAACGLCIMRVHAAQVAVRPYLLYSSSSHEGTPSGRARLPTASPPPTTILGSVDMMLTAIGTAIQVLLTFPLASPWPGQHEHSEHCFQCEDTPAVS